jgi:RNA polymerase sigma-70 factor (ECF subfamily)
MQESEFKQLYETYAKPLWAYVYKLTGDAPLAEDIIQESFIKIFASAPPHLTDVHKKSYVYRTATNLVYDYWRKNKMKTAWDDVPESIADESNASDSINVEKAFQRLSQQNRSLLWLAYAEDYTHDEIGNILKIKTKSVKVLLFRAKNRLVEIMNELGLTGGL